MKFKNLIVSLAMGVIGGCLRVSAGPVMVNAKLDSTSMLMGNVNTLHLEVVQDKGTKGRFPLFEKFGPEGIVTLLNDTIELGQATKIDTVEVGSGRIQINYQIPVQVFDSGYYQLPAFEYAVGNDTAKSKSLALTVVPVKVSVDDPISPFTDVADPENPSIFDKLPDWIYYYWWIYLLVIAAGIAGYYFWNKYKKDGSILPKKAVKTPYQQAIESLQNLKKRKLWESGREKEYYTELTEILRKYLDGRFGIKAMEMTSNEIMGCLADLGDHDIPRDKMRDVLDMADFVKFAMVRPLPDDNVALYNNAVDFVESTKPSEIVNPSDASAGKESLGKNTLSGDNSDGAIQNKADSDSYNYRNVSRRGRMAHLDDMTNRMSEKRLKVGKKINKREYSSGSDSTSYSSLNKKSGKEGKV